MAKRIKPRYSRVRRFHRAYLNLKRTRQILTVFIKYGFDDILERLKVEYILKIRQKLRPRQTIKEVEKHAEAIDLVVLDLIMPGLDGGKTFDHIRELQPNMPVILSSGYSLSEQAADIMNRGCNGFIQKPFNLYKLSQKVRQILDEGKE